MSYPFTVQANTWLSVTIPFAALGNPITLSALIWQDGSGSGLGQPTFYLDDISLIRPTPLTGVNLSGRTEGVTQIGYPFMATVDPMTTILPITYTWQSADQTPVIHTGDNLTDTVTFTWTMPGPKVITVTANNELGTATSTHLITLVAADLPIYTDTLAGGWQDWSWDTTRSFDNPQPVHSGSASIAVTYTAA